ncbi:50S ribosomal protein L17 [Thermodesulfobacteriota bacterium]
MRHRKARNKLGIRTSHREAMLRNMVTSLMQYESIRTTDTKAKAIRRLGDKMITLGKRGDLHARRQVLAVVRTKDVTRRLFDEIAPRFADRNGGYVRVIKEGFRPGDNAAMSIVELVEKAPEDTKKKAPGKAKGLKDRIVDTLKSDK